jgi:hypothetical protein
MHQSAKNYLKHEVLVRRGKRRTEWALKELTLIEEGSAKRVKTDAEVEEGEGGDLHGWRGRQCQSGGHAEGLCCRLSK